MNKILFFFLLISLEALTQNIDVQSYHLDIIVNDQSNEIKVREKIQILFTKTCTSFSLDLSSQNLEGKGMKISNVQESNNEVVFEHKDDKLTIQTERGFESNVMSYTIEFSGIPKDGLIIGENKYGARTFFGDNWPNRAHNWFACVDHPSDKASINYTVTTPEKYACVANGELKKVDKISRTQNRYTFESNISLPTKVMVIGIADLKSKQLEVTHNFEVVNWAYPKDAESKINDMDNVTYPLDFYIENIGPYPFEKLHNVQSTTRFGGMENAGCIFYDENALTGKRTMDDLLAHEVAHQWFGNSVTETGWEHLWLSEGFATYFTNLNIENRYGRDKMNEQLIKDRSKIIGYSKHAMLPVIDTISTDLMELLNPNAYQKGSWFLHMLREKIGNEAFWSGIRAYYETYKYRNASTNDFMIVMEKASGQQLQSFFNQWLRRSGHPILKVAITKGNKFEVEQVQEGEAFDIKLDLKLNFTNGESQIVSHNVATKLFNYKSNDKRTLKSIVIDPHTNLLFEEAK